MKRMIRSTLIITFAIAGGCEGTLSTDDTGNGRDAAGRDAFSLDGVNVLDAIVSDAGGEDSTVSDAGDEIVADAGVDTGASDAEVDSSAGDAGCMPSESCNGMDDDCDGRVDEEVATRSCGIDVGMCMSGTRRCVDGVFAACEGQVTARPETCDGRDNNCDGTVDNGVAPIACGSNVGACRQGTRRCTDGSFAACQGQVGPRTEVDDAVDNDCDGTVDEGFPCEFGPGASNRRILNAERASRGLAPMSCNRRLRYAAEAQAQFLCDSGATVPTHTGRGGSTPLDRIRATGVTFSSYAENVGVGVSSPQAIHDAWMASPSHRAALLAATLGRVGIAYLNCGGRHWWVQVFAD